MSHIPNNAMKHASAESEPQMGQGESGSLRRSVAQMQQQMQDGAARAVEKARGHPGAAIAIGGAVLSAIGAAAAVPLYRRNHSDSTSPSKSAKSAKTGKSTKAKASGTKSRAKKAH